MLSILSKSEATALAEQLRKVPDAVINDVNHHIVTALAEDRKALTYSKPNDLSQASWLALIFKIEQMGYAVKAESSQHDGSWLAITF